MTDLWQRQEFDTDTSFDRFQRFYLAQDNPRSVEEAYRRWKADKLGKSYDKAMKNPLPGAWLKWAWPKDLPSWPERARAYDDHLAELREAELTARHMPVAEVIALLSDIARSDLGDFSEVQGLDSLKEHPKSYLIKNLTERTSYNPKTDSTSRSFKIDMESKLDALDKLARYYGIFDDKLNIKLEGELDKVLDQLEKVLDSETFQKVVKVMAQNDN